MRGHVHNPHYYEWIKNGGGEAVVPGAMLPCGGLPTAFTVREALKNIILPDNFRKEGNEINSKRLFTTLQNTRELHYLFSDCNLQVITYVNGLIVIIKKYIFQQMMEEILNLFR